MTGFSEWLDRFLPQRGATPREEIQCYALPYGGIGFATHLLTYYTVIMLLCGRSPWLFRPNKHWKFDIFLSATGIVVTIIVTSLTMVRCRSSWPFVLLAVWKLTLSITLGAIGTHSAICIRGINNRIKMAGVGTRLRAIRGQIERVASHDEDEDEDTEANNKPQKEHRWTSNESDRIAGWFTLYALGLIVGLVGLFTVVHESWTDNYRLRCFTYGLIGFLSFVAFLFLAVLVGEGFLFSAFTSLFIAMIAMGLAAVFYSDWALAAIADNYAGTPDGNNAMLYWMYFAAKRLPLFSF